MAQARRRRRFTSKETAAETEARMDKLEGHQWGDEIESPNSVGKVEQDKIFDNTDRSHIKTKRRKQKSLPILAREAKLRYIAKKKAEEAGELFDEEMPQWGTKEPTREDFIKYLTATGKESIVDKEGFRIFHPKFARKDEDARATGIKEGEESHDQGDTDPDDGIEITVTDEVAADIPEKVACDEHNWYLHEKNDNMMICQACRKIMPIAATEKAEEPPKLTDEQVEDIENTEVPEPADLSKICTAPVRKMVLLGQATEEQVNTAYAYWIDKVNKKMLLESIEKNEEKA